MFKVICLISRKPGMAREDFMRHYETVHVPLVHRLVPALVEYRRSYVDPADWFVVPGAAEPDFDSVTEMWFLNRAGYETMTALNADPEKGKALADDAALFLDATKTRILVVEETRSTA